MFHWQQFALVAIEYLFRFFCVFGPKPKNTNKKLRNICRERKLQNIVQANISVESNVCRWRESFAMCAQCAVEHVCACAWCISFVVYLEHETASIVCSSCHTKTRNGGYIRTDIFAVNNISRTFYYNDFFCLNWAAARCKFPWNINANQNAQRITCYNLNIMVTFAIEHFWTLRTKTMKWITLPCWG